MEAAILDYFRIKLLQNPKRVMNENGQIVELYDQPERLNPEDASNGVCDSLNTANK